MAPAELQNSCQLENILKNTKLPFITDLKQLHYTDHISAKEAQLGKKIARSTVLNPSLNEISTNLEFITLFFTSYTELCYGK